jgi:hypothetical protein
VKITGWHYKLGNTALEKAVLSVVNYWHPKANAFRNGQRWLVLGTDELQERLPSIGLHGKPSVRSIQRALAGLRGEGIILIEHHRHPFRHGMGKVLWLRPNIEKIGGLLSSRCRPAVAPLAETNIQATEEQKTGLQDSAKAQGADDMPETGEDWFKEAKLVNSGEFLMKKKPTVEDALSVFSDKKGPEAYPSIAKPLIAHNALRDACVAAGYQSPGTFNKKRAGQMKSMLERWKNKGVAPEQIGGLIFFIAKRWAEFTGYCKTTFNVVVPGTAPNHAALTLYAVEAADFWQTYAKTGLVKAKVSGEHGSSLDEGL